MAVIGEQMGKGPEKHVLTQSIPGFGAELNLLHFSPYAKYRSVRFDLEFGVVNRLNSLLDKEQPELGLYVRNAFVLERGGKMLNEVVSNVINSAQTPELKGNVVKIAAEGYLAGKDRAASVMLLAFANTAELDLPEYGERFVAEQYESAFLEGNTHDAFMISRMMVLHRDRILNGQGVSEDDRLKSVERWQQREGRMLEVYGEEVIKRAQTPKIVGDWIRLKDLFDHFETREEGGFATSPSDLAQRVAIAMVEYDLKDGSIQRAIEHAEKARMGFEYIADLRNRLNPPPAPRSGIWKIFGPVTSLVA